MRHVVLSEMRFVGLVDDCLLVWCCCLVLCAWACLLFFLLFVCYSFSRVRARHPCPQRRVCVFVCLQVCLLVCVCITCFVCVLHTRTPLPLHVHNPHTCPRITCSQPAHLGPYCPARTARAHILPVYVHNPHVSTQPPHPSGLPHPTPNV